MKFQKESIKFIKLTKQEWRTLKMACLYKDIHHVFCKKSEHLCLLKPMNHYDHIHNHKKSMFLNQIPRRVKLDNLRYWKNALEDYEYDDFKQKGKLWI